MNTPAFPRHPSFPHLTPARGASNFWCALENIPLQCGVSAVWREWLGPEFEAIKSRFLQSRPGHPVRSYPCPRRCGCWHEVILPLPQPSTLPPLPPARARPSGIFQPLPITAVCQCEPWRCEDFTLSSSDLIPFQLSWARLARELCQAFALDPKFAEFGLYNTVQVGSWSVEAVPVMLTIQTRAKDFRPVITGLVARLRQPFVLLAPTNRFLEAGDKELLSNLGAGFFPLDSTTLVTAQGVLRSARTPGELFAAFNPQPKESVDEDAARRAFALIQKLDSNESNRRPSVLTVFRLYCIEELSAKRIARRCHCSRITALRRLKAIRTVTGADPRTLRKLSNHFNEMADGMAEPRAARLNRKRLINDQLEEEA